MKKAKKIFGAGFWHAVSVVALLAVILTGSAKLLTVYAEEGTNTITPVKPTVQSGTEGNSDVVYEISSAAELYWFAGLVNGDAAVCDYDASTNTTGTKQNTSAGAVLTADIVLNENVLDENGDLNEGTFEEWIPIANGSSAYKGTFDGQGHTVSGMYIASANVASWIGFFGCKSGTVCNLGIVDSYIGGNINTYVGSIVGYNTGGSINNCYSTATVAISSTNYVGGICGYLYGGTIQSCYNAGKVMAKTSAGITSYITTGTVKNNVSLPVFDANGNEEDYGYIYRSWDGRFAITLKDNLVMDAAGFASGAAAYIMNMAYDEDMWYQKLGTDSCPVLSKAEDGSNTVYGVGRCESVDTTNTEYINTDSMIFANSELEWASHSYINGICSYCDGKDPELFIEDTDGTYLISTAAQLKAFAAYVNYDSANFAANAKLMADIVLNENVLDANGDLNAGTFEEWTPIAEYTGTFDGQGHVISGLYIYIEEQPAANNSVGFIAINNGTVRNLGIVDSYIGGYCYNAGSIAGSGAGTIEYCYNAGSIDIDAEYGYAAGGIWGYINYGATMQYCHNAGKIKSEGTYYGGICGYVPNYSYDVTSVCYCISIPVLKSDGTYSTVIYGATSDSPWMQDNMVLSAEQFASGEAAVRLNRLIKTNITDSSDVWFQNFETDAYPVLFRADDGSNTIYAHGSCAGVTDVENADFYALTFTNSSEYEPGDCVYETGICKYCHGQHEDYFVKDEDGTYLISDKKQLEAFVTWVNIDSENKTSNAKLTADIVYNEGVLAADKTLDNGTFEEWTPIAEYSGIFDGQGHTISGLYINQENASSANMGLFGINYGTVRNLGVIDSYINIGTNSENVGGIAGYNWNGTIEYCYYDGIVKANSMVGGIAGYQRFGTIQHCYNAADVSGSSAAGVCGFAGYYGMEESGGSIYYCVNAGSYNGSMRAGAIYSYGYGLSQGGNYDFDSTELSSGAVAYTMNQNAGSIVWYQNIGEEAVDAYPVLDATHGTVYKITDGSGNVTYTNEATKEITVDAVLADGTEFAATVSGEGFFTPGAEQTVEAVAVTGYNFLGWFEKKDDGTYEASEALCNAYEYSFNLTDDVSLVAVYESIGTATLTVTGSAFRVNGSYKSGTYSMAHAVGEVVTLTVYNETNFMYWRNGADNKIVSTDVEYTFTVLADTSIVLVHNTIETGYAVVEFVSDFDQMIQSDTYNVDSEITFPIGPSKMGYEFTGWDMTADEIKAAITAGETYITVHPVYEKLSTTYTVTVYNGESETPVEETKKIRSIVTVTAEAVDGKQFSHWSDTAEGTIKLSTSESYTFSVADDITLYAIYVSEEETVEKLAAIAVTSVKASEVSGQKKISFSVTRDVPQEYELMEHGIVFVKGTSIEEEALVIGGSGVSKGTASGTEAKGVYTANFKVNDESTNVYVRGYMIIKDSLGNIETIYSEMCVKNYSELAE